MDQKGSKSKDEDLELYAGQKGGLEVRKQDNEQGVHGAGSDQPSIASEANMMERDADDNSTKGQSMMDLMKEVHAKMHKSSDEDVSCKQAEDQPACDKWFTCSFCSQAFTSDKELMKHQQHNHVLMKNQEETECEAFLPDCQGEISEGAEQKSQSQTAAAEPPNISAKPADCQDAISEGVGQKSQSQTAGAVPPNKSPAPAFQADNSERLEPFHNQEKVVPCKVSSQVPHQIGKVSDSNQKDETRGDDSMIVLSKLSPLKPHQSGMVSDTNQNDETTVDGGMIAPSKLSPLVHHQSGKLSDTNRNAEVITDSGIKCEQTRSLNSDQQSDLTSTSLSLESNIKTTVKSEKIPETEIGKGSKTASKNDNKQYPCFYCEKRYSRSSHRSDHERTHNINLQFKCPRCEKRFTRKRVMLLHHLTCGLKEEKKFECRTCNLFFWTKAEKQIHQQQHIEERKFACTMCPKTYKYSSNLTDHMRSHKVSSQFKCSFCGKCFPRKRSLNSHIKIHDNEQVFMCRLCNMAFKTQHEKKLHYQSHIDQKRYACSYCGKSYKYSSHCQSHERTHDINTQYKCSYCKMRFNIKRLLHLHEISHITRGDVKSLRIWKCWECRMIFQSSVEKKRHDKSHGKMIYSCWICGKQFKYACHRTEHEKSHNMDSGLKCMFCQSRFAKKRLLAAHVRQRIATQLCCDSLEASKKRIQNQGKQKSKGCTGNVISIHSKLFAKNGKQACKSCSKVLSGSFQLKAHEVIHHQYVRRCELCPFSCVTDEQMKEHAKERHTAGAANTVGIGEVLRAVVDDGEKHSYGEMGVERAANGEVLTADDEESMELDAEKSQGVNDEKGDADESWRNMDLKYPCVYCEKRFHTVSHRNDHERTHDVNLQTYPCPTCTKMFTQLRALVAHESICKGTESPLLLKQEEPELGRAAQVKALNHKIRQNRRFSYGQIIQGDTTNHLIQQERELQQNDFQDERVVDNEFKASDSTPVEVNLGAICEFCDRTFRSQKGMVNHQKKKHEGEAEPYSCMDCTETFASRTERDAHLSVHAGVRSFKCRYCPKRFKKGHHCREHELLHDVSAQLRCKYCDKGFTTKRYLQMHQMRQRSKKPWRCRKCRKLFELKSCLIYHEKVCTFEKGTEAVSTVTSPCESGTGGQTQGGDTAEMKKKQTEIQNVRRPATRSEEYEGRFTKFLDGMVDVQMNKESAGHDEASSSKNASKEAEEKSQMSKCKFCGVAFESDFIRVKHEFLHTKREPNSCWYCNQSFKSEVLKLEHESNHRINTHLCQKCGTVFKSEHLLQTHSCANPQNSKQYYCEICKQKFSSPLELLDHEKGHRGIRPYTCSQCQQRFVNSHSYDYHMQSEHGLLSSVDLKSERKKFFSCRFCRKSFWRKQSHLEMHEIGHTGPKPYECIYCKETFESRSLLLKHEESHAKEKPHQCLICGHRFEASKGLKDHIFRHGEAEVRCEHCNRQFASQADLMKHEKSHPDIKLYSCKYCTEKFACDIVRRLHARREHGIKYDCDLCSQELASSTALARHLIEHKKKHQFHFSKQSTDADVLGKKSRKKERMDFHEGATLEVSLTDCEQLLHGASTPACSRQVANFVEHGGPIEQYGEHDDGSENIAEQDMCPLCRQKFATSSALARHLIEHKTNLQSPSSKADLNGAKEFLAQGFEAETFVDFSDDASSLDDCEELERFVAPTPNCNSQKLIDLEDNENCTEYLFINVENVGLSNNLDKHDVGSRNFDKHGVHCPLCQQELATSSALALHLIEHKKRNQSPSSKHLSSSVDSSFPTSPKLANGNIYEGLRNCEADEETGVNVEYLKKLRHRNSSGKTVTENNHEVKIEKDVIIVNIGQTKTNSSGELAKERNHEMIIEPDVDIVKIESTVDNCIEQFCCKFCQKNFNEQKQCEAHEVLHTPDKLWKREVLFRCKFCEKNFSEKKQYKAHERLHTPDKLQTSEGQFWCKFCQKCFSEQKQCEAHEGLHTPEKVWKCDICETGYFNKKLLMEHKVTEQHRLLVDQKDYGEKEKGSVESGKEDENDDDEEEETVGSFDIPKHTHKAVFKCENCWRVFMTQNMLDNHAKVHISDYQNELGINNEIEERPMDYDCVEVESQQKTSSKSGFNLNCEFCWKLFSTMSVLVTHIKTHIDHPMPYRCKYCAALFKTGVERNSHEVIHYYERKFQCRFCGRRFKKSWHKNDHERLHSGDGRFRCEACKHRFQRPTDLWSHEQKHHGEGAYSCSRCKMKYANFRNFQYHWKLKHGTLAPPWKLGMKLTNENDFVKKGQNENDFVKKRQSTTLKMSKEMKKSHQMSDDMKKSDETSTEMKKSHQKSKEKTKSDQTSKEMPKSDQTSKEMKKSDQTSKEMKKSDQTSKETTHSDQVDPKGDVARTFACPKCNSCFKTKHHLSEHVVIHDPNLQHKCELCNRRFVRLIELWRHESKHSGLRKYKCPRCRVRYFNKASVLYHRKTQHGYKLNLSSTVASDLSHVTSTKKSNEVKTLTKRNGVIEKKQRGLKNSTIASDLSHVNRTFRTSTKKWNNEVKTSTKRNGVIEKRQRVLKNSTVTSDPSRANRKFRSSTKNKNIKVKTLTKRNEAVERQRALTNEVKKLSVLQYDIDDKRQRAVETENQWHQCPDCYKAFVRKHDLTEHQRVHDFSLQYPCEICQRPFMRRITLWRHEVLHVNEGCDFNYKCPDCMACFFSKHSWDYHRRMQHGVKIPRKPKNDQQKYCKIENGVKIKPGKPRNEPGKPRNDPRKPRNDPQKPKNDLRKPRNELRKPRNDAQKTSNDPQKPRNDPQKPRNNPQKPKNEPQKLKKQLVFKALNSDLEVFTCFQCSKTFTNAEVARRHKETHIKELEHKCTYKGCLRKFRSLDLMGKHYNQVHQTGRPFQCTFCTTTFKQYSHLVCHEKRHFPETLPYMCEVCKMRFVRPRELYRHEMTHDGERPHGCPKCIMRCFNVASIMYHKLSEHGISYSQQGLHKLKNTWKTKCLQRSRSAVNSKQSRNNGTSNRFTALKKRSEKLRTSPRKKEQSEITNQLKLEPTQNGLDVVASPVQWPQSVNGGEEEGNSVNSDEVGVEDNVFICELCTEEFDCERVLRRHKRLHAAQIKAMQSFKQLKDGAGPSRTSTIKRKPMTQRVPARTNNGRFDKTFAYKKAAVKSKNCRSRLFQIKKRTKRAAFRRGLLKIQNSQNNNVADSNSVEDKVAQVLKRLSWETGRENKLVVEGRFRVRTPAKTEWREEGGDTQTDVASDDDVVEVTVVKSPRHEKAGKSPKGGKRFSDVASDNDDVIEIPSPKVLRGYPQDRKKVIRNGHIPGKMLKSIKNSKLNSTAELNHRSPPRKVRPSNFMQLLKETEKEREDGKAFVSRMMPVLYDGHCRCCIQCGKRFETDTALAVHKKWHKCDKRIRCLECNTWCDNDKAYRKHWKEHALHRLLYCKYCGKDFPDKELLWRHEKSHNKDGNGNGGGGNHKIVMQEKTHVCDMCSEAFVTADELKVHQVSHTAPRAFVCEHCSMSFNQERQLRSHQTRHVGDLAAWQKSFGCPLCGGMFKSSEDLKSHEETFHGCEGKFECKFCERNFGVEKNWRAHEKVHRMKKDKPKKKH